MCPETSEGYAWGQGRQDRAVRRSYVENGRRIFSGDRAVSPLLSWTTTPAPLPGMPAQPVNPVVLFDQSAVRLTSQLVRAAGWMPHEARATAKSTIVNGQWV